MTSQAWIGKRGWPGTGHHHPSGETRNLSPSPPADSSETETRWQRHVVETIWVVLLLTLLVSLVLVYGNAHGWFIPVFGHPPTLPPPWPEGA